MVSLLNRPAIVRDSFLMASRLSRLVQIPMIALAKAEGLFGGTSVENFDPSMISGIPPTLEPITGNPHAKPSRSATPKASFRLGKIRVWHERIRFGKSGRLIVPKNSTRLFERAVLRIF